MTAPFLLELSAEEAVRRIARGELRAEEYASHLLSRSRELKSLNTITWIDEARVLEAARTVDRRRARGERPGQLAGMPVIVKDNIDVAGTPSAAATLTLRDNIANSNAPVVQRLLDCDAIFFAKANMHELAGGGTSSNPGFGIVRNPYDRRCIPGGSSGGTAAALAAQIVPAGLGSDTAGSVRIPSALSGTAGLRPTILPKKLYPDAGVVPLALDLDTIGPMARSVADVALLHSAITGTPFPTVLDLHGLRIGVPRRPYWEDLEPEVERVTADALAKLRSAGAILVDVDTESYYPLASEVYRTLVMYGIKCDLRPYLADISQKVTLEQIIAGIASRDTKTLFESARDQEISAAEIHQARTASRQRISSAYQDMFRKHQLAAIIFPTEPIVAPLIKESGDLRDDEIDLNGKMQSKNFLLLRNTHVTGALGVPGISLPAGLSKQGLPVGLELDGLAGQDSELLGVGMAVERVLGPLPAPTL
jgi:mandelamide amidase